MEQSQMSHNHAGTLLSAKANSYKRAPQLAATRMAAK
jgi:hypothetical protein